MQIVSVQSLALPEVKLIRFRRFMDERGSFCETFRAGSLFGHPALAGLGVERFVQMNESFSRPGVVRGLHLQWAPPMAKLVRALRGRLIDLAADVRPGSPRFGKIIAQNLPRQPGDAEGEWIFLPPGFAHGVVFTEETSIEYLCSAEYNPSGEGALRLIDDQWDWSLCQPALRDEVQALLRNNPIMAEKDRQARRLQEWAQSPEAQPLAF